MKWIDSVILYHLDQSSQYLVQQRLRTGNETMFAAARGGN